MTISEKDLKRAVENLMGLISSVTWSDQGLFYLLDISKPSHPEIINQYYTGSKRLQYRDDTKVLREKILQCSVFDKNYPTFSDITTVEVGFDPSFFFLVPVRIDANLLGVIILARKTKFERYLDYFLFEPILMMFKRLFQRAAINPMLRRRQQLNYSEADYSSDMSHIHS